MYFEFKNLKNIEFKTVELLVSLVFALTCLLLLRFFPLTLKNDIVEIFLKFLFFLVIFPIIYVRIILKKTLADMYVGGCKNVTRIFLPIALTLVVGVLSICIINQSFLRDYYYSLVSYLSVKFQVFLVYELIIAVFYLSLVIFSFGFMNLITKNFNKLNKILPIFCYFILLTSFYQLSLENVLISILVTLPTVFFRKIVNVSRSIWILYFILLILNIILNAVIIKA